MDSTARCLRLLMCLPGTKILGSEQPDVGLIKTIECSGFVYSAEYLTIEDAIERAAFWFQREIGRKEAREELLKAMKAVTDGRGPT